MNNILIKYEKLGDLIKYTCKITQSHIVFKEIDTNIIQYEFSELDWDNPKLVINLLSAAFYYLGHNNYKKFRYYISDDEKKYININNWIIIDKIDDMIHLECDFVNAFDNFMEGFEEKK